MLELTKKEEIEAAYHVENTKKSAKQTIP